jgi:hypothetical protein
MSNRREFVKFAAMGVAFAGAAGVVSAQQQGATAQPGNVAQGAAPAKPPALDRDMVREFVIAGHGDLEKVKAMLAKEPGLLNATWDWGGGDFEMAIGGAGHMGRPDIANYLISQGGRFDIFVAAMLGRLDIVKNALAAFPNLAQSKGPHGIPLMAHARKGGESAAEVVAFLESLKS